MDGFYWVVVDWEGRYIQGGYKKKESAVKIKECLENVFPLSKFDLIQIYICGV